MSTLSRSKKPGALFFAQLLTEARPAQAGGTVTLAVHYYLNGARIGGFAPAQRMGGGGGTRWRCSTRSPELAADTSNRFEVRLQAAGGTVYTAAGGPARRCDRPGHGGRALCGTAR